MEKNSFDSEEGAAPHTVIDMAFVGHCVYLTLMCHFTRFHIEVKADDLKVDPTSSGCSLYEDFVTLCDDNEERLEDLLEWMISPCRTFFGELAPAPDKTAVFTLEDYYHPPTYCYRLQNLEGSLVAETIDPQLASLSQYPDQDILQLAAPNLKKLPRSSASDFEIIRSFEPDGVEFCEIPKKVRKISGGKVSAFKAVSDDESFIRELNVYSALQTAPHGEELCHIPDFHELVLLGDKVLGFTLERVDHDDDLYMSAVNASQQEKARWFAQISRTVRNLHQRGLVWGDVKPQNVLIETGGDAYVLDFGGGYDPKWVDMELCNSQAGDLQGLRRIKDFLDC